MGRGRDEGRGDGFMGDLTLALRSLLVSPGAPVPSCSGVFVPVTPPSMNVCFFTWEERPKGFPILITPS